MISFRYHVVSIVAVFLALALGRRRRHDRAQRADHDDLRKQVDSLNTDRSIAAAAADAAKSQDSDADSFAWQFGPLDRRPAR